MNADIQQAKFTAWKKYRDALTKGPGAFRGEELAAWDEENPCPDPTRREP